MSKKHSKKKIKKGCHCHTHQSFPVCLSFFVCSHSEGHSIFKVATQKQHGSWSRSRSSSMLQEEEEEQQQEGAAAGAGAAAALGLILCYF